MAHFLGVWRPTLLESIDGLPLATTIDDLFFHFPYDRLPESQFLRLFLRPECVLAMLVFYLASKPLFQYLAKVLVPNPRATWFVASIAIHNFALAVFSFLVAYNSWPIVVDHFRRHGAFDTYCDPRGALWGPYPPHSDFGAWAFVFYVSKYYEFADTWILVLKGKPPSFLQVYHHTGIAFCMWVGVLSQSSWLKAVVLLNAVIHTLMYTYFLIKTVSPATEIGAARYLTRMQIGQFFTGILYSVGVLIMGERCDTQSSRFGLACLQLYGYGLIALFMAFARRKYQKKA
jgi:GNS1/SUR4 family